MASAIPFIGKEFGLSALQMGAVMSAFFVGYATMQFARRTARRPARLLGRIIVIALLSWSIFTALHQPRNVRSGTLLAIRVLFGLMRRPPSPASCVENDPHLLLRARSRSGERCDVDGGATRCAARPVARGDPRHHQGMAGCLLRAAGARPDTSTHSLAVPGRRRKGSEIDTAQRRRLRPPTSLSCYAIRLRAGVSQRPSSATRRCGA